MTSELREAAIEFAKKHEFSTDGYVVAMIEHAMLLAANVTRELCCQFPNKEMTGATNNHEVRKRILLELKGEKV
jgi:hypothetical protein